MSLSRRTWIWAAALGASAQAEEAPDLAVLRRYLRGIGTEDAPVPTEALGRLETSDPAWKAVRAFLEATAAEDREREQAKYRTRRALAPEERSAGNLAQWEVRAAALMDLARAGNLADDVYQEARRSLEEELKKGLKDEGAVRIVLGLLEPELKDLPAELRKEVADLLAKLGDKEYDTREAATKRLLEIGEPALGALRPALDHPDPEVKERVHAIWRRILGGAP